MKNINTAVLLTIFALVLSLFTREALASSVYQLSNCTEAEYQSAKTQLAATQKAVTEGWMSGQNLASAEVFYAEISYCAGKIPKSEACQIMIKSQKILAEPATVEAGLSTSFGRFDEIRRYIQIREFCK